MMQLSNRQIKIIARLLTIDSVITTKKLADQFNVSIRTIKNDLNVIQEWMTNYGDYYQSKPHAGIWVKGNIEDKEFLKHQLLCSINYDHVKTPQERVEQIILLLTVNSGFITTQQLENKLAISKNTVIADLDKVEQYLKEYQLYLERKNYYGYHIRGSELNIRSIMETILNRALSYYEIPVLMSKSWLKGIKSFHFKIVPEIQNALTTIIKQLERKEWKGQFDINDVLTMVIRMLICIVRLSINQPINSYKPLMVSEEDENIFPYRLFSSVNKLYDFTLLKDEYEYLLRGVNPKFDNHNILKLTRQVIEQVSSQTKQDFYKDNQLQVNLFSHLLTRLNNKYKFANEYNPFVVDLKKRNPALFEAVKKALRENISSNPTVINDSFVAFVTLHFLVSLEERHVSKNAKIIYVCSTGIGVTSLIKKEIERNISNVEIAGFASINNVVEKIRVVQPDLVVSIFPITGTKVPVIQVNPLPSKNDLQKIQNQVAKILNVKPESLTQVTISHRENQTLEETTHTLLMKGTLIFEELQAYLKNRIPKKYREPFMMHVMMAVHRIYFHHSYDSQMVSLKGIKERSEDIKKIKQIFLQNQLEINMTEISAILQYTRMDKILDKEDE